MSNINSPQADPEEGEIVDDDLEEISDNSIILNETGKSPPSKEHLPVISLSSVTESDSDTSYKIRRLRKLSRHRHHHHHHHHYKTKRKFKSKYIEKCHKKKKWRELISSSSGSDSSDSSIDLELDKKLQNQLKAAIQVQPEVSQKNSLESRLKAMTNPDILKVKVDSMSDNVSEEKPDEIDDELIQLRLEALKTAVLNKFEHRKRKRVKELEGENKRDTLETNKENDNENINKKLCLEENTVVDTAPDEDEDVLRALLLASISKKITKDAEGVKKTQNDSKQPIKPIFNNNNNISKKNVPLNHIHVPPKIKPIIINLNADSDTDEDKTDKTTEKPPVNINNIENTVEKFLKEQRAKVESQLISKNQSPITPKAKISTQSDESVILEKSAVKLLPKVKQIEYQKLLQKLKMAQKKHRIRRVSVKGTEKNVNVVKNDRVVDIKQDARILHNLLKQMQKQKDGRLQIEEKYVVLTPIIKKINEASTERKKSDQDVKRLLEELGKAKAKLHESNQKFSSCVKELVAKKQEIDKSLPKIVNQLPKTSTPIKSNQSLGENKIPVLSNVTKPTSSDLKNVGKDDCNATTKVDNPTKENDKQVIVTKYVSPLDTVKRDIEQDPFVIMCPYDIDGNCRDPDCGYKHYFR